MLKECPGRAVAERTERARRCIGRPAHRPKRHIGILETCGIWTRGPPRSSEAAAEAEAARTPPGRALTSRGGGTDGWFPRLPYAAARPLSPAEPSQGDVLACVLGASHVGGLVCRRDPLTQTLCFVYMLHLNAILQMNYNNTNISSYMRSAYKRGYVLEMFI